MRVGLVGVVLVVGALAAQAQGVARPQFDAFEVAMIRPVEHDAKGGRFLVMQGTDRFVAKDYTLKLLIAAAYDLNPRTVSGGPGWMDAEHFDITAVTPGGVKPTRAEQMAMLRSLLVERFRLAFHREEKEFSIYRLEVGKGGAKLKESAAAVDAPSQLVSVVYPQKMVLPARNVSMGDFVAMLQRAVLDRPVVDKTGLMGRYDFDLEWAPDETQFGGEVPVAKDAAAPSFFTAVTEQLGLRVEATKGMVSALVVDRAERPSAD